MSQEMSQPETRTMSTKLEERVKALLVENGWTPLPRAAIAEKHYETVVGPKQAHIYLYPPQPGTTFYGSLKAEYWSEGRNALSTCYMPVRDLNDEEELRKRVATFLTDVEYGVSQTYAVRLLRSRNEQTT